MFRLEWERKSEVARNRKDRKIGEERKNREDGFRSGTFVTILILKLIKKRIYGV